MVTAREKWMIGGVLLLGGLGVVGGYLIMPTFDSIMKNTGKIVQLEGSVLSLQANSIGMEKTIKKLKTVKALPEGLEVRTFKPETFQKNIKGMVDEIVELSTNNGNDLISLVPWAAPEIPPPPVKRDANGTPVGPVPSPLLKTFGYELVIRGSYDNVLEFIGSLNEHNQLIEIKDIKMENEGGEDRSTDSSDTMNPFKPIKLKSRLILYLQPKT